MKRIILILLVIALVLTAGCIGEKEADAEEKITETPVAEEPEIEEEPEPEEAPKVEEASEKKIEIIGAKRISDGKDPEAVYYDGELYVFYNKYTGKVYDTYYKTYDSSEFSDKTLVVNTTKDDYYPTAVVFEDVLFLFTTQVTDLNAETSLISYTLFNGKIWTDKGDIPKIEYGAYRGASAEIYDSKLHLFWSYGLETQRGKIYSKIYETSMGWYSGPQVTLATGSEKNPSLTYYKGDLAMLYESYAPKGNDIYHKKYDESWSGATKISETNNPLSKTTGDLVSYKGKLYAIWVAEEELYLRIYDGTSWGETTRLTENKHNDEDPSLAEFDGKLYITWTNYEIGGHPNVYFGELRT